MIPSYEIVKNYMSMDPREEVLVKLRYLSHDYWTDFLKSLFKGDHKNITYHFRCSDELEGKIVREMNFFLSMLSPEEREYMNTEAKKCNLAWEWKTDESKGYLTIKSLDTEKPHTYISKLIKRNDKMIESELKEEGEFIITNTLGTFHVPFIILHTGFGYGSGDLQWDVGYIFPNEMFSLKPSLKMENPEKYSGILFSASLCTFVGYNPGTLENYKENNKYLNQYCIGTDNCNRSWMNIKTWLSDSAEEIGKAMTIVK